MLRSFFLISFLLLALCYLPALCLPFAHHDNVRYFEKLYSPDTHRPEKRDPQYAMVYLLGRPLTAEIHQCIFTHISRIKDISIVRWVTVFAFAICAGFLANIFYSYGLSYLEALSISIAIFILPGVQDSVLMIAIQNALAILAVLFAYQISRRQQRSILDWFVNDLIIFYLILTSMLLYPQWSFFIFVPLLAKYLTGSDTRRDPIRSELTRLILLFALSAVFYYYFTKTFISLDNSKAGVYAFTVDLNFIYWKFLDFFTKILPMAFNFWNFHTVTWLGLVLMGLTVVLLKERSLLGFAMMLGTVSFWLIIRTDIILHRIFFATSAIALTTFLLGIHHYFRDGKMISKYILLGIMTAGLLGVNHLTYLNALNYNIEFNFIKQSLLAQHKPFNRVHIVLAPSNNKGYNGQETVDDVFNARTASYTFSTDTLNLLKAALKDINYPSSWWVYSCEDDQLRCVTHMPLGCHLLVTHSKKGQPLVNSPGMVLIDLNDL